MATVRSLLFAAIFYSATVLWVLAGMIASLFGRRPTLAVVLSWVDFHNWLARNLLHIRSRVEGDIPTGPHLIAGKHEGGTVRVICTTTFVELPVCFEVGWKWECIEAIGRRIAKTIFKR